MNRIDAVFEALRSRRPPGKALMPFVCGGRPSLADLPRLLAALEGAGASVVEIGVPFSDPIADGPVIAAAMHEALESGVTTGGVFDAVRAARSGSGLGFVAMVSVSIVHRMGAERFAREAASAGFDGVIVPDLPVEESSPVLAPMRAAGLTTSLLVAPTTPPERAARIAGACTGFVYLQARLGITGESDRTPEVEGRVSMLRGMTDLPIACGFGIATPAQAKAVAAHADAVIVGSALVRRVEGAAANGEDAAAAAAALVSDLAGAIGSGPGPAHS